MTTQHKSEGGSNEDQLKFIRFFLALFIFMSCTNLLPSSKVTVKSPWKDFNDAKLDYEKIIPGITTVAELSKLDFNPYQVPNIRIMNATDIINIFMPNPSIRIEMLDPGIQKCIASKDRCTGYRIEPTLQDSKRIGGFWADLFGFKRDTVTSGWEFWGQLMDAIFPWTKESD